MPGAIYRPRMWAVLSVPTHGNASTRVAADASNGPPIDFPVRVRKAVLEQNDHTAADSLHVTLEWADAGVDPRLLSSATIQFYLGVADQTGQFTPTNDNLRFVGIARSVERVAEEGGGFVVEMEFHDYTALFLESKPFVTKGVPALSQSLDDAWRKICDYTGYSTGKNKVKTSVAGLRERLVLKGELTTFPSLSKACSSRFAKFGKISIKKGCDAWGVWLQCCEMLGLISYVKLDQVIVTTATDYYSAVNPPRLIWGKNILSWREQRRPMQSFNGICAESFDPLTGKTLEAFYPPIDDPSITPKRLVAKTVDGDDDGADPEGRQASSYEYQSVPGVTSPTALLDCAKRIYEERSRQQLVGTLETVEMSVSTTNGSTLDLLTLGAGEVISVEFGTTLGELDVLARGSGGSTIGTIADRVQALIKKGYSEGAAQIIAANLDDLSRLDTSFFTKTVRTTCEHTDDGGTFQIAIGYCNRIFISGDAQAPATSKRMSA